MAPVGRVVRQDDHGGRLQQASCRANRAGGSFECARATVRALTLPPSLYAGRSFARANVVTSPAVALAVESLTPPRCSCIYVRPERVPHRVPFLENTGMLLPDARGIVPC